MENGGCYCLVEIIPLFDPEHFAFSLRPVPMWKPELQVL